MLMAAFAMLICLSPDAHAKKQRGVPIAPAQLAHGLAAAVPVCQVRRSSCFKAPPNANQFGLFIFGFLFLNTRIMLYVNHFRKYWQKNRFLLISVFYMCGLRRVRSFFDSPVLMPCSDVVFTSFLYSVCV